MSACLWQYVQGHVEKKNVVRFCIVPAFGTHAKLSMPHVFIVRNSNQFRAIAPYVIISFYCFFGRQLNGTCVKISF